MKSLYLILTDGCNLNCTFCYKKVITSARNMEVMTPQMASDAIEWMFDQGLLDPDSKDTNFYFWGGEPFVAWETMKATLERYPTLQFCVNTNGLAVKGKVKDFILEHKYHLRLTLSMGSAYDKFGSLDRLLEVLAPAVNAVKESEDRWAVNMTISRPDRMFEDFEQVFNEGIQNLTIDMPTHMKFTEEYKKQFIDGYLKIMEKYRANKNGIFKHYDSHLAPFYADEEKKYRYCGSGVDRLLIDFRGDIYPCDGLYIVKEDSLGNINGAVDFSILDKYQQYKKDPSVFYQHCIGCEIEMECPRAKCIGLNIERAGDRFVPDPDFCDICKTFAELRRIQRERFYETAAVSNN